jgi:hypothetical protein
LPGLSTLVDQRLNRDALPHNSESTVLKKPTVSVGIYCIAAVVLAGCGGSSRPTATIHARQTPLMSNPDIGGARQRSGQPTAALGQLRPNRSHSTLRTGKSRLTTAQVVKARQTPETSKDDKSYTGVKLLNPCTLVSLSEAQNITGGAITKLTEAPLGPTCVYSGHGKSGGITLAVETESFRQVTHRMSARKPVVVRGHQSVCGRFGTQMLFVPIGRYQLLNVTAPCGIAQRFATLAVSRLSA